MTQRKRINRILAVFCILSMMFSMLESGTIAFATSETESEDITAALTETVEDEVASEIQASEYEQIAEESAEFSDQWDTEQAESIISETVKQTDSESGNSEESKEEISCKTTDVSSNIEEMSENPTEETEEIAATTWNTNIITGESVSDGITASVSAPVGSFPEGTTVQIQALSQNEAAEKANAISPDAAAVAFDITFLDAEGNKVQPGNGKTVSVSFSVPAGSSMNLGENNEKATFNIYHIADNGTAELMKSVSASDADSSANINVEASSFSVYMLMKESEESAETTPLLRAGTPHVVDVDITNFQILNYKLESGKSVYYTDSFYLSMDWAIDPNAIVNEGDYFDIDLPPEMNFGTPATINTFDLTDGDGTVVATAHITPGENGLGGTVHVVFNSNMEGRYNVKGDMYFAAQFDTSQITTGENNTFTITVNGDTDLTAGVNIIGPTEIDEEILHKLTGGAANADKTQVYWMARINYEKANLTNVVITDTLGSSGETFVQDSFVLRRVVFNSIGTVSETLERIDVSDMITFSPDGATFTLNLGDISGDQYYLTYRSTYTPETVLKNSMTLTSEETEITKTAQQKSSSAGGSGSGSLASRIKITKVDADDVSTVLAGAVFSVIGPDGNTFILTTGPDGTVTSDVLRQGVYTIDEIVAPVGYEIDPEESHFTLEVTSDGGAVRRVKNHKISTIDIPVVKVWDDADNQDGIRPLSITVKLLADGVDTGKTVVLSEANNWQDSFTELSKTEPIDGHEIVYSVEEDGAIPGYTSRPSEDAENGFTITNIHQPEVIDINGTKTWDDNNDQDGARPDSVTIRLLADGTEIDSVTVGEVDDWSWSFTDLPKYKNEGTEIVYSITEDAVSGYTPDYNGYDVTNQHTPGKTSVTVSKAWNDADNQDGIRPLSITVKLLANDADTGKTVELNAANNWIDSFTDLDEYQNGQKINYKVEEVDITGYSSVISGDVESGYTITNTHQPEVIDINGTKTWDDNNDQDGARPDSVTIRLLADGTEIDSVTVGEADDWSWSFTDLPKYKNEGTEIVYSITEDAVSGYTPDYNGYDVTNQHTPGKTSVTVSKAWNDVDNQDGIRPLSITVKLLANDVDTGKTVELNAANNWTASFTELDEYQNKVKIVYTVDEVTADGYTAVITGDAETGFTVTNTHEPERIEITGSKTWDDNGNQDEARPASITIRLLAGGTEADSKIVTEADGWSWSFENLPRFANGTEISYSITEDAISDYTTTYNGYNVTNTHTPGKTSLTVSKAWNDADNQDGIRPLSVTVKLLANDVDTDKTVELSAVNNWTASFIDLDEYQNGAKIEYTIEEVALTGYTTVITGDAGTGYTITNTHEPEKTSIAVTKVWDDQNNKSGNRPQSITIRLQADGKDTGKTLTLNADNKWTGSFTGLDRYLDGKEIVYTITEDSVSGYTTSIKGSAGTGFTVTNTKTTTPSTPPTSTTKTDTPKTGDSSNISLYLWMMLLSGGALALLLLKMRKRGEN